MTTKINAKFLSLIFALAILMAIPTNVYANEEHTTDIKVPTLTSISFKGATIDQKFDPSISEYTITLDNPNVSPTLKENKIDGDAKLFVNYTLDPAGKQTGIVATLKNENLSVDYTFKYSNPQKYEITSNNNLGFIECELCEVYPELNDKQTNYKLYIPSDLNEIKLSVGTQDTSASCIVPGTITLNSNQTMDIKLDVVASDTSIKNYTFEIERIDMTCDEVRKLPDSQSIIKDKITTEKLGIIIIALAIVASIALLIIFLCIAKKLTVKVCDADEKSFFGNIENNMTKKE